MTKLTKNKRVKERSASPPHWMTQIIINLRGFAKISAKILRLTELLALPAELRVVQLILEIKAYVVEYMSSQGRRS